MDTTYNSIKIQKALLIIVCILSVLLSLFLFRKMKTSERMHAREKTALVKKNTQLETQIVSMNQELTKKTDAITAIELEKNAIQDELARLNKDSRELIASLKKEMADLKDAPLNKYIERAIERETDDSVKRVLADTITKITMVKEGRAVSLEPIMVTGLPGEGPGVFGQRQGNIISVDKRNNLIVINLGRIQGIQEGQRCIISDGQEDIGSGSIIRTRYKISAVFIDTLQHRHTIQDVKEGLRVNVE